MKLETPTDLVFVVAVLVPGFIFSSVLSQLVPRRLAGTTETIILGYLTGTAFNYAVCGFPVYLVISGLWLVGNQLGQLAVWCGVTFLAPIILAVLVGAAIQHEWLGKFFKLIGLRWINLVPTGWDWIFSRTKPSFILVTLQNGTQVAGWMGELSMASSDPDKRDLYIEEVYIVEEGDQPWKPAPNSGGILIEAGQIAYIEFKGAE
jgi:hypothetical protein